MSVRPRFAWQLRTRTLSLGERTLFMGILNVTPDSFSDGGLYLAQDKAVAHGLRLLDQGADILDIGGESTRPGAEPLTTECDQARVLPVIEAIRKRRPEAILSVDTYHARTALAALEAGVEIVNDVSGLLWDRAMASVIAEHPCGLVLMQTRGTPLQWATQPRLAAADVLPHVLSHLQTQLYTAHEMGIDPARLVVDPGFGFGIRGDENFTLLAHLAELQALHRPILAGTSRKRFVRTAFPEPTPETLLAADTAAHTAAILAGTHILRVHEIPPARAAAAIADAILNTRTPT